MGEKLWTIKDLLRTLEGADCQTIIRFHGCELTVYLDKDLNATWHSARDANGYDIEAVGNAQNQDEACRAFLKGCGINLEAE